MPIIKFLTLIRHSSTINQEMPSQVEQDIAEAYVCEREIFRPKTNITTAIKKILLVMGLNLLLSLVLYKILDSFCVLSFFFNYIQSEYAKAPFFVFLLIFLFLSIVFCFLFLRKILIGIIRLYQHYASEDVRRRCLFKPTCSEYTILALKKYGVIIGLYKAYIRILKKCRGNIYRIDYP